MVNWTYMHKSHYRHFRAGQMHARGPEARKQALLNGASRNRRLDYILSLNAGAPSTPSLLASELLHKALTVNSFDR